MEQTVIDGVPVFWKQGPAPMTATLSFGCGARDETFRTIGITHLIEHLAMSALPRVHYEHNASVDMEITEFYATGKPEQLVEFLGIVCRALGDLPLDRIEKEAGVLAAEGSHVTHPTAAMLLGRRFGAAGHGLAPWVGPGYDRIPADSVAAHAARFFTRGNAVLTLTGPPPEGLRLPLPDGPRPVRQAPQPLPADGPSWSPASVPSPGLAMLGPGQSGPHSMGFYILSERLTAVARKEKGLSYEVGGGQFDIDPARSERAIWVDAREGQEVEVTRILWDTARQLASFGPEPEEIAHEVAGFAEQSEDPRWVGVELDLRARSELLGYPYRTVQERLAELAAVTPDQVATAMADGLRGAIVVVPQDCAVELSDLDGNRVATGGCWRTGAAPEGQVFKPPLRARMMNGAARRARLVLTADAVAMVDDDGDLHLVRFADVVGVEAVEDARVVFGRSGCVVPVDPGMFRGASAAVAALDNAVDPELCYQRTELISFD